MKIYQVKFIELINRERRKSYMKSINKTREEIRERETQKETLQEAFVLWKVKSKSGMDYLSGNLKLTEDLQVKVIGYFNGEKKNPNEPDIKVYSLDHEGNQDKEICALWEQVSHAGKRYFTGVSDEKEKVVAFYNNDQENNRPYIRCYYK